MTKEQNKDKENYVFIGDESFQNDVQPIKHEKKEDRPKPVKPPKKK
jgi:hypothetical protein